MDIVRQLRKLGFTVEQFDEYHHRVNDIFDFWLNKRGRALSWRDRLNGEKGVKPKDQMAHFIKARLDRCDLVEIDGQETSNS